jgi:hypothetical protein
MHPSLCYLHAASSSSRFIFYQRRHCGGLTFSFVADKSGVHFSWADVIKVARILSPPIFMRVSAPPRAINSKIGERAGHISRTTFATQICSAKNCSLKRTPPRQTENHKWSTISLYADTHWQNVSILVRFALAEWE